MQDRKYAIEEIRSREDLLTWMLGGFTVLNLEE